MREFVLVTNREKRTPTCTEPFVGLLFGLQVAEP